MSNDCSVNFGLADEMSIPLDPDRWDEHLERLAFLDTARTSWRQRFVDGDTHLAEDVNAVLIESDGIGFLLRITRHLMACVEQSQREQEILETRIRELLGGTAEDDAATESVSPSSVRPAEAQQVEGAATPPICPAAAPSTENGHYSAAIT